MTTSKIVGLRLPEKFVEDVEKELKTNNSDEYEEPKFSKWAKDTLKKEYKKLKKGKE